MANKQTWQRLMSAYSFNRSAQGAQRDHDAIVASEWQKLTEKQRQSLCAEDYRTRIWFAGFQAGQQAGNPKEQAALAALREEVDAWRAKPWVEQLANAVREAAKWRGIYFETIDALREGGVAIELIEAAISKPTFGQAHTALGLLYRAAPELLGAAAAVVAELEETQRWYGELPLPDWMDEVLTQLRKAVAAATAGGTV